MVYGQLFCEECLIPFTLSSTRHVQHLTRGISLPFFPFPTVYIKLIAYFNKRDPVSPNHLLDPQLELQLQGSCRGNCTTNMI